MVNRENNNTPHRPCWTIIEMFISYHYRMIPEMKTSGLGGHMDAPLSSIYLVDGVWSKRHSYKRPGGVFHSISS